MLTVTRNQSLTYDGGGIRFKQAHAPPGVGHITRPLLTGPTQPRPILKTPREEPKIITLDVNGPRQGPKVLELGSFARSAGVNFLIAARTHVTKAETRRLLISSYEVAADSSPAPDPQQMRGRVVTLVRKGAVFEEIDVERNQDNGARFRFTVRRDSCISAVTGGLSEGYGV